MEENNEGFNVRPIPNDLTPAEPTSNDLTTGTRQTSSNEETSTPGMSATVDEPIVLETNRISSKPAAHTPESAIPQPTPQKDKKKFPLIPVIIGALILGSAVGVFFLVKAFQKPETIIVVNDLPEDEEKFLETSSELLFTTETLPRIDASLATQPLTDAFVQNLTGKTTAELGIEYSNTHPAYVKLINNEADLIVVTEPSEEELALAAEKGIELEVTKVVNEGFAFFVNKNNPVSDVSFDDVVKIYTGEIANWKDLGGNDAEIIAYQRPENSGSQTGLYNLVLKGKEVKIPTIKESVTLSMAGIVDYVASYDNAIDSIGYGFYYYVNTMYYNDQLKYLAIDGVAPTYATIQNETYPILSAYYIVTRKSDENENVAFLKKAMLSRRGQYVASEAGYVPVGK